MIKYKLLPILILFISICYSDDVKQNKIDQDPWIKYFSFVGPYKSIDPIDDITKEIIQKDIVILINMYIKIFQKIL